MKESSARHVVSRYIGCVNSKSRMYLKSVYMECSGNVSWQADYFSPGLLLIFSRSSLCRGMVRPARDHNVKSRRCRCVSCRTRRGAPVPPINLVMAEKLPRLRLKTHPATAIFSQHLRITRNCRSFALLRPVSSTAWLSAVPGNPRRFIV